VLITDDADAAAVQAARQAYAAGLRVSVLGIGTLRGAPIPQADGGWLHDTHGDMVLASRDDRALAAVAAAGGGRYVPMTADHADIDILHTQLQVANDPTQSGQSGAAWQDRGPWLLLPLLLLVALSFRRGWLCVLALGLLPWWPVPASAGTWSGLWQRPDQQAAAALQSGDAKRAQALAHDPAWRGAADYRAGDYAAAAQALKPVPGARAAYNRGNALARQGLYAEALDDYARALQLDPALADAKANRQAVEQWLSQHKPQSTPQDQQAPGQKQQKQQQGQQKQQQGQSSDQPSAGEKTGKDPASQSAQNAQRKSEANSQPASASSAAASPASASTAASPPATQADKGDGTDHSPEPMSAQQQAEQQARAAQAQRALQQQMDKALAEQPSKSPAATHELGAIAADDPTSKLPVDVRRALQSVRDDPGALLRRKFELEYQQRHGGVVDAQEQP
jgi:Ca-activated chloride channel family protein